MQNDARMDLHRIPVVTVPITVSGCNRPVSSDVYRTYDAEHTKIGTSIWISIWRRKIHLLGNIHGNRGSSYYWHWSKEHVFPIITMPHEIIGWSWTETTSLISMNAISTRDRNTGSLIQNSRHEDTRAKPGMKRW